MLATSNDSLHTEYRNTVYSILVMKWQTHKKKIAYKSQWTTLREDKVTKPDGTPGIYNLIEAQPSVMIVPWTRNDKIYLVNVWRYPTKRYSWELPGGRTDGADPIITAKNELQEETGLIAKKWDKCGVFNPLNGLTNEDCHTYLAQKLEQTGEDEREDDGISDVQKFTLEEVDSMIQAGEIHDGQSICALTLAKLFRDRHR